MSEEAAAKSSKTRTIILALGGTLAIAAVVGFFIYSSVCPCERTPGSLSMGERASEAVTDWTFASDLPLW